MDKKDHELGEKEKQQIRDRIEHTDGDVFKLATEFHCAPIQIAGIKAAMHRNCNGPKPTLIKTSENIDDPTYRRKFLNELLTSARYRAEKAPMDFDITLDDVVGLYEKQGGLCAVSRLKFNLDLFPEALVKKPYAPSIDGTINQHNVCNCCGVPARGPEADLARAQSLLRPQPF